MASRCGKKLVLPFAIGLCTGLFAISILAVFQRQKPPQIDLLAVCEQIRFGDSPDHVASLVGLPPGDYRTQEVGYAAEWKQHEFLVRYPPSQTMDWRFDQAELVVFLNADGVVEAKTMLPGVGPPETLLKRVWRQVRSALPF
jgi:hypothetical protein